MGFALKDGWAHAYATGVICYSASICAGVTLAAAEALPCACCETSSLTATPCICRAAKFVDEEPPEVDQTQPSDLEAAVQAATALTGDAGDDS